MGWRCGYSALLADPSHASLPPPLGAGYRRNQLCFTTEEPRTLQHEAGGRRREEAPIEMSRTDAQHALTPSPTTPRADPSPHTLCVGSC
ncbi:hypothetical protein FKM82_006003 [Ascaphus truei]